MRKDLKQLNATGKTVSSDVAKLKSNTDKIPDIEKQLKNLQSSINTMKKGNVQTKETLKDSNRRLKVLEKENVEPRNDLDMLKSTMRREINLNGKQLEELVTKHIQTQNDKNRKYKFSRGY